MNKSSQRPAGRPTPASARSDRQRALVEVTVRSLSGEPAEETALTHPPVALTPFLLGVVTRGGNLKLARLIESGTKIIRWVRQSTGDQLKNHKGGMLEQLAIVEKLRKYGVEEDDRRILTLGGQETAHRPEVDDAERETRQLFENLLDVLDSGDYRVVLLFSMDRIARNYGDAQRFLTCVQRHRVLLMVGDRVLDPSDRFDRRTVWKELGDAISESEATKEKLQKARFAVASEGWLRVGLPSGLVYAHPQDRAYSEKMAEAGLGHLLTAESLARHRFSTKIEDLDGYLILPIPDKDVEQACRRLPAVVLECGSISKAIRLIAAGDPSWPEGKAGKFPLYVYRQWREHRAVEWRKLTPTRVRNWLTSPSVYGIFAYFANGLLEYDEDLDPSERRVHRVDAFPSFATAEDMVAIDQILAKPLSRATKRKDGRPDRAHPTNNKGSLPSVHCDGRDGEPCGATITGLQWGAGEWMYVARQCREDAQHPIAFGRSVETAARRLVLEAFSGQSVDDALAHVRVIHEVSTQNTATLNAERARLDAKKDLARQEAAHFRHGPNKDAARANEMDTDYGRHRARIAEIDRSLEALKSDGVDREHMVARDIEAIRKLAADVPALLAACDEADRQVAQAMQQAHDDCNEAERLRLETHGGNSRRVLAALGVRVGLRHRPDGDTDVTVSIPSGWSRTVRVSAAYAVGPQAERVWVEAEVRRGTDVATICERLNGAERTSTFYRGRWTEAKVRSCLEYRIHYETRPDPSPGEAPHSLKDIVTLTGEPFDEVFAACMAGKGGRLGRARIDSTGKMRLEATPAMRHAALIESARRHVAVENAWPLEDTFSVSELSVSKALSIHVVGTAARSGSGVARDWSGRRFTRESLLSSARRPVAGSKDYHGALNEALAANPELAELDRMHWLSLADAQRLVGRSVLWLKLHCQHIELRSGGRVFSVAVWMSPDVQKAVTVPTITEAVAAYNAQNERAPLDVRDFVPRPDLVTRIASLGRPINVTALKAAARAGRVLTLEARRDEGNLHRLLFVWYLRERYGALTVDDFNSWLSGTPTSSAVV